MGAFSGGLQFRTYRVERSLPASWQRRFLKKIEENLAEEIDPEGEEEQRVGWCNARSPFDTRLNEDKVIFGDALVLGFRLDRLTVPSSLLRLHCEREAARVAQAMKKENLSRYELAEIREAVAKRLRRRALPSVKSVEMVLQSDTGVLRFFSTSKGMNELFVSLFEESFSILLIPDTVYTLARGVLPLSEGERGAIERVEACSFCGEERANAET